jgi:hypothetical protein
MEILFHDFSRIQGFIDRIDLQPSMSRVSRDCNFVNAKRSYLWERLEREKFLWIEKVVAKATIELEISSVAK